MSGCWKESCVGKYELETVTCWLSITFLQDLNAVWFWNQQRCLLQAFEQAVPSTWRALLPSLVPWPPPLLSQDSTQVSPLSAFPPLPRFPRNNSILTTSRLPCHSAFSVEQLMYFIVTLGAQLDQSLIHQKIYWASSTCQAQSQAGQILWWTRQPQPLISGNLQSYNVNFVLGIFESVPSTGAHQEFLHEG